jgi:hypothetical protein
MLGTPMVNSGPVASASVTARTAATARTVCTITDKRLIGLSGLVVTATGFVAVSDSNIDKEAIRIWYLDRHCHYLRAIGYPTSAYDPEDLALGRDGTLYVADIGDNDRTRTRIAMWRLRPGDRVPKLFRYAYPDGPHDAEALILAAGDTPVFVTKDPMVAGLYAPTGPPDPSGTPVALAKVGTFALTPSGATSGVGPLGGFVVTGGANSADRREVALRSYTDAYEWDVPDGDVVKAITTDRPRITPLADEPQGESIAYAPDGAHFYTVSDQETVPARSSILEYPSAAAVTRPAPAAAPQTTRATHRAGPARVKLWTIAAVAALGLLLAAIGGWTVLRALRSRSDHLHRTRP